MLRTRRLDHQPFVYVWLDATYVHVREHRHVVSKAVVIATGLRADGHREVLGVDVGDSENETFWREFLTDLVDRGLAGVRLVISDAHAGLIKAIARCFQGAAWQRCRVHAMRRATRTWAVTRPRQWVRSSRRLPVASCETSRGGSNELWEDVAGRPTVPGQERTVRGPRVRLSARPLSSLVRCLVRAVEWHGRVCATRRRRAVPAR